MNLRHSVLKSLQTASKDDLPIMVKFIVSCVTPKEAVSEIDTLRENLNLEQQEDVYSQLASQR